MTQNLQLRCSDCKSDFLFTASEQDEFAAKGFTNKPGRCLECRAARKARLGEAGVSPNTANRGPYARGRNNSFGGGYDGGSGREGGSGSGRASSYGGEQRETFEAVCSTCGKMASLPFQPTNDRPVYCRNCFKPKPSFR
ncbi:MAG: CxxC-x17-CxxC domain-containing protein [Vulcanimicrobiaceae bacterium]|jgi:CxxC-x17-CxxC domain-containing protein